MRNSLKAKAARYSVQHDKDCGVCDNCKGLAACKALYEQAKREVHDGLSYDRAYLHALHNHYLETMRLKPCTERGKK